MSNDVLSYHKLPPISGTAVAALVMSILGLLSFWLVIPPIVALIFALIEKGRVEETMDTRGLRLTKAAVAISACGVVAFALLIFLFPSGLGSRRRSSGSYCQANLSGISKSLQVYAADEGILPVVPYMPHAAVATAPHGSPTDVDVDKVIESYYKPPFPHAGTIQANAWLMALKGQLAAKQYVCRSDPFANLSGSTVTDATGKYYDNFQDKTHLSYSLAYPWKSDGTVGPWWHESQDGSLPLVADMTPLQGTGRPSRNLTPLGPPTNNRTWNSANHDGIGQNVGFADGHVEFFRRPDIGQSNDNIYTTSGTPSKSPAQYKGIPAGTAAPALTSDRGPYDIILLPVRNETTGAM